jgi:hypothetical protein
MAGGVFRAAAMVAIKDLLGATALDVHQGSSGYVGTRSRLA